MALETAEAPAKVSATWLRDELEGIKHTLRILTLQSAPAPLVFYKPMKDGTGRALKVQIRLQPQFKGSFVRAAGAVFLEWVPQKPSRDDDGNAQFDWENPLTAKLGIPDLTSLLYAIRCRVLRVPVSAKDPAAVSLFHKFEDKAGGEQTTVIKYELQKTNAILSISKSKTERSSISLTLQEELALELYLQHALQWSMFTGKR